MEFQNASIVWPDSVRPALSVSVTDTMTGTAASGLLLLRIVDPDFDTPVAVEVGLMNVFATILFKPISWSMPFVPVEGFPMLWIFVAVTVVTPIVMYFLKMIRKPAF